MRIYIILFILLAGCTGSDQKSNSERWVVNEVRILNTRLIETIKANLDIVESSKNYNSDRFQFMDAREILKTYKSSIIDDPSHNELLENHQYLIDSLLEVSWHYTEPWKTHVSQILERNRQNSLGDLSVDPEVNNELFYNLVFQLLDKHITEVYFWSDMKYPIVTNQRIIDNDWAEMTVEIGSGPFSQKNKVVLHIDTLKVSMNEYVGEHGYDRKFKYRYQRKLLKDSILISVSNTNVNALYRVNSAKKFKLMQE